MRALIVTAVLGTGTVLVFGAAFLVAALFPNGSTIGSSWNGGGWGKGGMVAPAIPMPAPVMVEDSTLTPVVVPDTDATTPEPGPS